RVLYQRFLHRSPGAPELQAVVGLLSNGGSDEDAIASLLGSAEYFQNVPGSFATATIDWGDGSPSSKVAVPASSVAGLHTYTEEGGYTVAVHVTDVGGSSAGAAATAQVTAK